MERSSKRGKIPQQDWPSIIKRYESGETLASIARTYDCSPPAISYIVSRSRARDVATDSTVEPSEPPRLVKGQASEMPAPADTSDLRISAEPTARNLTAELLRSAEPAHNGPLPIEVKEGLGDAIAAADLTELPAPDTGKPAERQSQGQRNGQQNGERRTLHLSLAQDDAVPPLAQNRDVSGPHSSDPIGSRATERQREVVRDPPREASHYAPPSNGGPLHRMSESSRARDGGEFIDQALRARVEGDITAFLTAFDAALAGDTPESRARLREATDRLLRAGARTRIELERLEARIPMPPRENIGHTAPAWRWR